MEIKNMRVSVGGQWPGQVIWIDDTTAWISAPEGHPEIVYEAATKGLTFPTLLFGGSIPTTMRRKDSNTSPSREASKRCPPSIPKISRSPARCPEFQRLFPDDAACAAYLEAIPLAGLIGRATATATRALTDFIRRVSVATIAISRMMSLGMTKATLVALRNEEEA